MKTTDARNALLAHLIDHAPMFPPASLPPEEALAEDARASASRHAFVLGRLVWPASRALEIADSERGLSVVLDASLPLRLHAEAVEVLYPDDPSALAGLAPEIYVEVAPNDELDPRLDVLASLGLSAKVRCGGASVPSVEELARFVRGCRQRRLAFKATAGLHHAIRSNGDHGFLNLLAAAVFDGDETATLDETDASAFDLGPDALVWRDRSASTDVLARVRREVLRSIGSCSFFEPVEELEALGVLAP
jgi:hypothetical protein